MYNNTKIKVIKQIYLQQGIHKRGLSKQLNLSMPSIDYALQKIRRLIIKQRAGNQIRYYLDYSKYALTPLLHIAEYSRFEELTTKVKLSVRELLKELKEKPILALIFGSYARGDYTSKSDIDILLVFQVVPGTKQIENTAKRVSMNTNTQINPIYLDYNSFKSSFHNPTKEFFKDIKKDKIILTGLEWWRQLKDEEA